MQSQADRYKLAQSHQPIDSNGQTANPELGAYPQAQKTLGPAEPRHYSISEMEVIAEKTAKSRMFGGSEDGGTTMTADQAFMMGMIAEALNIPYAVALLRFDIVMGKPAMKSAYVLAEYQRLGGNVEWVETTDEKVKAVFTSKRHPKPFSIEITLQQLKDRRVAMKYDKQRNEWKLKHMYQNHPRSMLRWRAAVEVIRATDPGIFMGMYADVEAEDIDVPASEQNEVASKAQAALVDRLAGRRENPKENHPPVSETAGEMKAAEPPKEPATEWGKCVATAVLDFNQTLAKLADEQPQNLKLRNALKNQQVINGVLNLLRDRGDLDESKLLNDKGKRDNQKCADMMSLLWNDESDDIQGLIGQYLAGKMLEYLPKEAPEAKQEPLPLTS